MVCSCGRDRDFLMEVCGRGFLDARYGVSMVEAAWIAVCRRSLGGGEGDGVRVVQSACQAGTRI